MASGPTSNGSVNLGNVFNAFAAKAVADFPELKESLVIYNSRDNTLHGSFPAEEHDALLAARQKAAEDFRRTAGTRPAAYAMQENGYTYIDYLDQDLARHNYKTAQDPYERELKAQLEHELAHFIVPGAGVKTRGAIAFKESAAEAFSFLRQQQQFGAIGDQVEVTSYIMANIAVMRGDTSHFAIPVLHQLARMSDSYNLARLSPAETANAAYRAALAYEPSRDQLRALEAAFSPVRTQHYGPKQWEPAMFETIAEITLGDHGENTALIFETGKAFLDPFLHKRTDIIPATLFTGKELEERFGGAYWDSVRERLAQAPALTSDQQQEQTATDMMVLGKFDEDPAAKILPAVYEREDNMQRLKRAKDTFAAKPR